MLETLTCTCWTAFEEGEPQSGQLWIAMGFPLSFGNFVGFPTLLFSLCLFQRGGNRQGGKWGFSSQVGLLTYVWGGFPTFLFKKEGFHSGSPHLWSSLVMLEVRRKGMPPLRSACGECSPVAAPAFTTTLTATWLGVSPFLLTLTTESDSWHSSCLIFQWCFFENHDRLTEWI